MFCPALIFAIAQFSSAVAATPEGVPRAAGRVMPFTALPETVGVSALILPAPWAAVELSAGVGVAVGTRDEIVATAAFATGPALLVAKARTDPDSGRPRGVSATLSPTLGMRYREEAVVLWGTPHRDMDLLGRVSFDTWFWTRYGFAFDLMASVGAAGAIDRPHEVYPDLRRGLGLGW